jgi:membrane associated rhomboid family serine protease
MSGGAGHDRGMARRRGPGLLGLIYLIVGVAVAASHHYFAHLSTFSQIASAVLAVVLWPLILLGISLHIKR